jgi:hypothetical protein
MLRLLNQPHNGGAKDGEIEMSLAVSERVVGVERVAGGWIARPKPLAACGAAGGYFVRPRLLLLATYRPAGGVIRAVLVKEDHGWFAVFCTDPNASVVEILEAFAGRATIEQDFHDVKEVWGAGQQQVRNIWTNVAVFQLCLWMHTLVELWAWNRSHDEWSVGILEGFAQSLPDHTHLALLGSQDGQRPRQAA